MGNSASSSGRGHHDETVDYGHLTPQGVYTGSQDWNHAIVSQLICQRKLAPFYRPLEEYDDTWDDDQILAARKTRPEPEGETVTRTESTTTTVNTKSSHSKRPGSLKEPSKPEASIYRNAVECPICFLYYPPNINYSRCCDQAICTECFVQIKRNEPTTTHLVSEPAACPYCVQDNFGVVYTPPIWRAGIGSEGLPPMPSENSRAQPPLEYSVHHPTHKRRQKSYSADSPEVVTIDQIRPDWEAKLAAVRAAVARRANRRIIMRQVGDRLIPVGVTSGRVHALGQEEGSTEGTENGGSRRSRRRNQSQGIEQFLGMAGQDLEELMLMEAMRLSLLEHEEQQRKEAAERKKQEAEIAAAVASQPELLPSDHPLPGPGPSTLETRSGQSQESSLPSSLGSTLSTPRRIDSGRIDSDPIAPDQSNGSLDITRASDDVPSTNQDTLPGTVVHHGPMAGALVASSHEANGYAQTSQEQSTSSFGHKQDTSPCEVAHDCNDESRVSTCSPDLSAPILVPNATSSSTSYTHLPSSSDLSIQDTLLNSEVDVRPPVRKTRPSTEAGQDFTR